MVYTYTPTYYFSLHNSITSLCKNIIPFSFKKRRLPAIMASKKSLSKQQSENLKWQQDSFHQILKLMGLCQEGILPEAEFSAFRSHLLGTLIASPPGHEEPTTLSDKLIFLQELLYAKCISEDEYHSSKRPLLQRLAVQGAEIEARDMTVGTPKQSSDEEWSVIDLKDDQCLLGKGSLNSENKLKHRSAMKRIKGAASVFSFVSSQKNKKIKEDKDTVDKTLFQREQRGGNWDGEKWKRSDSEDETAPLPLGERSDSEAVLGSCCLVKSPIIGGGPDTQQIKRKLHSNPPTDFFIDKVLGEQIKEVSRIRTELIATNPNLQSSSWCDQYGGVVTDVVKKELKNHVGEMGSLPNAGRQNHNSSKRWTTFDDDDDENCHPNLFIHQDHSFPMKQEKFTALKDDHHAYNTKSSSKFFKNNPFFPDYDHSESAFCQDKNPFWSPRHGSSMIL
ncbi:hypothetical protein F0562_030279 [Nyssa sinensis]|uniref:Uncharacterized protein n=1 Tax=Nyssa sinensis TaxID=561372 RepID=A0A5J5AZJ5_9ASTE|nr:hypothetical protein F0562_030279 [Nyssa sinensis]